jgi:hypothetical protein
MGGELWISNESDMFSLQTAMSEVGTQAITIETYVDQWVCQKDGFEPTDICVLKPLAAAMDALKGAFDQGVTTFFDRWDSVREEAARAVQDIERQDHHTVKTINVLMNGEQYITLPSGKKIPQ